MNVAVKVSRIFVVEVFCQGVIMERYSFNERVEARKCFMEEVIKIHQKGVDAAEENPRLAIYAIMCGEPGLWGVQMRETSAIQ
jgi:hypothetical protein